MGTERKSKATDSGEKPGRKTRRARRGRQEGSIYYRESDQRWVGSISVGYTGEGRRRRRTVYGATKQEVQDKLRELQNDAASGKTADAGKQTVAQYLLVWLDVK